MSEAVVRLMDGADLILSNAAGALLLPLAICILISGLDDLAVDLAWVRRLFREGWRPLASAPVADEEARLAVWIPLWQEAEVIGPMLEHNLSAIGYTNYEIFVGCYPNDDATMSAARLLEARHPRVHIVMVPHDGPTSKADNLNFVYAGMSDYEEEHQIRFDAVVIHDAEDLIHPTSFSAISAVLPRYEMVQVPVLPLNTPFWELTHGVYCDDFAEGQGKDLETRIELGGFLPGCGVGTVLRRDALDLLAEQDGEVFRRSSLTEDYDIGLRLHRLGARQHFMPLTFEWGTPLATREYFPRALKQAVRQRSRWITGNSLQAWERYGWGRNASNWWFLWRDRKGVFGNPISLACNVLVMYGLGTWMQSAITGGAWLLGDLVRSSLMFSILLWINTGLLTSRMAARYAAVGRIYGWGFAGLVPVRMVWGNLINSLATVKALHTYVRSRVKNQPLVWVKTQHAYPHRSSLAAHKRRIGEVLVANGYCSKDEVELAAATKAPHQRIGERLVEMGVLTEELLYEALSLQQDMPCVRLEVDSIPPRVARALPGDVMESCAVIPFRIENGGLHVAGPWLLDPEAQDTLRRYTRLDLHFHLTTPTDYERMRRITRG